MKVTETDFRGLVLLEPKVFEDSRGLFLESFNQNTFRNLELPFEFVQDNQSHSIKNVIRGLHFQKPPHAQTKLVRVIYGRILDVVVDLRIQEKTFGKAFSIELSDENKRQLLIPKGFAHGFSVLSDTAGVFYKCDDFYNAECDAGVYYNDEDLKINWGVSLNDAIVSGKDKQLPRLSDLKNHF